MCGYGLARRHTLYERSGVMGREREADGAWRRDLEQLRKDLKPGDGECPVRTMTYMEILTDWFRKSGDKQESNRKERGRCLKNLENLTPAKN